MFERLRILLRNLVRFPSKGTAKKQHLAMNQVLKARSVRLLPTWGQIKHLPKLLSKTERRVASIALVVVLLVGGLLSVQLLNSQRTLIAATGGAYTEGLVGTPQLINPLYAITSDVDSDLTQLIFSGLMRFDNREGLITDLAQSYEISEDGKTYTFTLRSDASWHDGKPVRVEDILFTLNAISNPDYRSPLAAQFSSVEKIEQVDEQTFTITLSEPFAPFLSFLTVGILPSHLWTGINPLNATLAELNRKPIGSGPYAFEKFTRDGKGNIQEYRLHRYDEYYLGSPYITELSFRFYATVQDAVSALRNNNVEGIAYLPPAEASTFERKNDIAIVYPSIPQYDALFFNQKNQTILQSDTVREALAHATDKQALVETALSGNGTPIDSLILDGMIGEHEGVKTYTFDQALATSLLEEAGWTLVDGAEIRTKDDQALRFTITTLNAQELSTVAETIKEQWRQVGVDVSINLVDAAEFQNDTLQNRNYEILLSGELYGIDADPYAFWHSSQTAFPNFNLSGFSNREADNLIESARVETDESARAEDYQKLQDIIADELPAIFLYQPRYPYATASKIHLPEIERIAIPSHRFSNVHEWFIRTKRIFSKKDNDETETTEENTEETTVEQEETETPEETTETPTETAETVDE